MDDLKITKDMRDIIRQWRRFPESVLLGDIETLEVQLAEERAKFALLESTAKDAYTEIELELAEERRAHAETKGHLLIAEIYTVDLDARVGPVA